MLGLVARYDAFSLDVDYVMQVTVRPRGARALRGPSFSPWISFCRSLTLCRCLGSPVWPTGHGRLLANGGMQEVMPDSPASLVGLRKFDDFIVGSEKVTFQSTCVFLTPWFQHLVCGGVCVAPCGGGARVRAYQ